MIDTRQQQQPALTAFASLGTGDRLRFSDPSSGRAISSKSPSGNCNTHRRNQHLPCVPRPCALHRHRGVDPSLPVRRNHSCLWRVASHAVRVAARVQSRREMLTLSSSALRYSCSDAGAGVLHWLEGGSVPASLSLTSTLLGVALADRALATLFLRWNLRKPSRPSFSFLARSLSVRLSPPRSASRCQYDGNAEDATMGGTGQRSACRVGVWRFQTKNDSELRWWTEWCSPAAVRAVSAASAGDVVAYRGGKRCEGASHEIKVVQRKHGV